MDLSIAYINDVHGYLEPHAELLYNNEGEEYTKNTGGYSRIASVTNRIRKHNANTLLFDGGDTFHGTLPLIESKGQAIIPLLNALNFDAMVAHWDFAYGPAQLLTLANQLTYPILAINVFNGDGALFLPPYRLIQVEDLKIAVIGICSDIIDKTMPKHFSEGLTITDGSIELPNTIRQVKKEGADIVILLSHNGFPQDVELLSNIDGVDICLSAHTHNRLYEAVTIKGCRVIQCGCHGSFVGHIKLNIQEKRIADLTYELILIDDTIIQDEAIEKLVADVMIPFQNFKNEIVGQTSLILHRYNTLSATMDDLLLTAIKSISGSELAFSNGWRYGIPIPIGPITKWDLYNIIPMNPFVSTVTLTGQEILNMLEENLERTFSRNPMLQMGGYVKRCLGLQAKIRIENPSGHRIQQLFIGCITVEKERKYKVAFVTMQGVPEKFGSDRKKLVVTAVDAMAQYLKDKPEYIDVTNPTFSLV